MLACFLENWLYQYIMKFPLTWSIGCFAGIVNRMACGFFMDMGCSGWNLWYMSDGFWWLLSWLQTPWWWLSTNMGCLQPCISSSLYFEVGEFSICSSTLSHVSSWMAVQRMNKGSVHLLLMNVAVGTEWCVLCVIQWYSSDNCWADMCSSPFTITNLSHLRPRIDSVFYQQVQILY